MISDDDRDLARTETMHRTAQLRERGIGAEQTLCSDSTEGKQYARSDLLDLLMQVR